MSALVYNCDSTKSSDSSQEQACCHYIATVCISNSQYSGFGGPWVSAVSALVSKNGEILMWKKICNCIIFSPLTHSQSWSPRILPKQGIFPNKLLTNISIKNDITTIKNLLLNGLRVGGL